MAAVYSAQEGGLPPNLQSLPSENNKDVSQDDSTGSGSRDKDLNVENGEMDLDVIACGPVNEAREHAEVAVPLIRIKEEQIEENDYVTIQLGESGEEDLEEQTDRGEEDWAGRDESAAEDCSFDYEDCSETLESKESYLEHRWEHTHDGPIVCLDTDTQWNDLLVSTDGGRRTLCCALCGRKFSSSRGFFTHQLKHRNQEIKQESISDADQSIMNQKLFECNDCGKTFSSVGQCLNHQRSHKQASKSLFHQIDDLKKKSFQCPTCGRSYSRASALDAHRRCHEVKLVKSRGGETEKLQSVDQVPVKSEDSSDPTSELTDDSQKKLFECPCGKSFRTLCGLATHQRFSSRCLDSKVKMNTKRSFECTECGKTFVSSTALKCHQQWHKRRAQHLCNGQPFKCKECGKDFTSLTFYNKHQRTAHSKEMPAKSFLHQVFQLQKKAFECQDCGRRFSRASALQSHQLCHTDVFSDIIEGNSKTSPGGQASSSVESEDDDKDHFSVDTTVYSQGASRTDALKKKLGCDIVDGEDLKEMDNGYEIVSIPASDTCLSDCTSPVDQNPDLELVCESDQEEREDLSFNLNQETESISGQSQSISPKMNVKIVQIDYEPLKEELVNIEVDGSPPLEARKYDCPDCDRTFAKAVSLRCHMLWHKGGMGKKTGFQKKVVRMTSPRRVPIICEICGHESSTKTAHYFHLGKHEDRKPYKSVMYQLADLQKNSFTCEVCGMHFSRLSAFHAHQQHHNNDKKPFKCLQCEKSYSTRGGLYNHQKVGCHKEEETEKKVERFNPTKTLLGPKEHHCKKCGKGFWSLGALYHHKQYHTQCADVKKSRVPASSQPEDGHARRKRRGRKRGLVSRYSRKPSVMSDEPKEQTESKEHKCDVCGKSYRLLACFLKHQLVHNDHGTARAVKSFDYQVEQLQKNSYSCPDCGKRFSRAMALQFHMKCHGYETGLALDKAKLSNASDGPQCQSCHSVFTSESALHIHQKHCVKPKESEAQPEEVQLREMEDPETSQVSDMQDQKQTDVSKNDDESNAGPDVASSPADLKYRCDDCGRCFSGIGTLNFHKRIHSIGLASQMDQKNSKWAKKLNKSSVRAPFTCLECGRKFSTNSALGTHRRWHKDKKVAKFTSKNSALSKRNTADGPFLCNQCGKGFFYLSVLRRHQKYHPPLKAQPDSKGACEPTNLISTIPKSTVDSTDRENSFPSEDPVGLQKLDQPVDSPPSSKLPLTEGDKLKTRTPLNYNVQCSQCYMSFLSIRGLRAHKWQKHKKAKGRPPASSEKDTKPFACSGCGKCYSSKGALHNHKKSCNGIDRDEKLNVVESLSVPNHPVESPMKCLFKCHKCGKAFPTEAQLDVHKEAARSRPHSCALCCRGYWTQSQLQQHLVWHDEVRRRLPTELRYRLNTSVTSGPSACYKNAKAMSPIKLSTPSANSHKGHRCLNCNETFLSSRALQQHQTLHVCEGPYHCSLCPRTFGEIRDLIDHHQECLGDKELQEAAPLRDTESLTCTECGIPFSQETDLHQHYIEHARGVL